MMRKRRESLRIFLDVTLESRTDFKHSKIKVLRAFGACCKVAIFLQMHKYGHLDPAYMMPYMGRFYFNNTNYIKVDTTTLKEYIRNQM